MTKILWQRLIDEIRENNPHNIVLPFWRGESLLHPSFIELMEYALNRQIRIHISTNGHLVTGDKAAMLQNCEFVTFSIHTQLGYERAKEFIACKKRDKPTVQISFVKGETMTEQFLENLISTENLDNFDSVRLYEEHSVDGILGKSATRYKIPRTFCQKLEDSLVIAFDGKVSRCCYIWETENNNINANTSTIKDVWNSDILFNIRERYPDRFCAPCDQWSGHTCGSLWHMSEGEIIHEVYSLKG